MTIEEAIMILAPETRRESLREIPVLERIDADQEACRIAVASLRAQRKVGDNEPKMVLRTEWETPESCPNCMEHLALDWSFCPECGRPTDWSTNEPLTLDELREMDGEPVWIVEYPDWGHWELSQDAEDYLMDRAPVFYGLKHNDPDGKYGLHKVGWLAYCHKPEGEQNV